ncbi:MAG: class I tRNA ligase family protein [Bacilli bacterium]|nr:class I tRNA ligase family protein [Bacilli bacterium]
MLEKKYPTNIAEKEMQEYWDKTQIYKFEKDEREIYSVDTPPPTISGKLHIGHIFSYTQAEILVRFKRLMGYNVFYPFGFDDNGLPTERLVEKKTGIMAKDMPRSELLESVRKSLKRMKKNLKTYGNQWGSMLIGTYNMKQ